MKLLAVMNTVGLAIMLTFAGVAEAGPGKRGRHGKGMKRIFAQLELSQEQEAKIKGIHQNGKEAKKALHEQMKVSRDAFHEAMKDSEKSDAELTKLHNAFVAAKMAKMSFKFEKMLQVRAVLTPDQRAKFQELSHKMKGKHGKRGKHHKKGGPGMWGDGPGYDEDSSDENDE